MVAKRREQAKTSRSERPRRRHLDDGSFARLPPVMFTIDRTQHIVSFKTQLVFSLYGGHNMFSLYTGHSRLFQFRQDTTNVFFRDRGHNPTQTGLQIVTD